MADFPLATSSPPLPMALTPSATSAETLVPVSITELPDALRNLVQAIKTRGIPENVTDTGTLTLETISGKATLALAQHIAGAERQKLIQTLMSLVQAKRPLTLTVQAGSPPTQGTVTLPPLSPSAATAAPPPVPPQQVSPPPMTAGTTYKAIVLPPLAASGPETPPTAAQNPVPQTSAPVETNAPAPPLPQASTALIRQLPTETTGQTVLPQTPHQPSEPLTITAYQDRPAGVPGTQQPLPEARTPQPTPLPVPIEPHAEPSAPPPATAAYREPPVARAEAVPEATSKPQPSEPQSLPHFSASTSSAQIEETPQPPAVLRTVSPAPYYNGPDQPAAKPIVQAQMLLTPGREVSVRVVSVLPPETEPKDLPPLAANQILATVQGTGTEGQALLKTATASLFIKTETQAPIGTKILLDVDKAEDKPFVTLPSSEETGFKALPEALAALEQAGPHTFQNVMLNFLPQPTKALPGALMFLLSAFKQGNVRTWLGDDAVDTLVYAGKEAIVKSLAKDLSTAGQSAQDPVVGEWRSYPIPLYANQQFQALSLYVRNDREGDGNSGPDTSPKKIRFLIDMRMSKLGALQVDGFVQTKKLDMILRSERTLPDGLHAELRQAYIKALDAIGYAGTLGFQVGRQHWMVMKKPAPEGILT